jgi:hypothetical protein
MFHAYLVPLLLVFSATAYAHTNEYLDTIEGAHGGQLRMSGAYHFELVAAPGELTVYVTDHADNPMATAGATATALVDSDGSKTEVLLVPTGDNAFRGQGGFALNEQSKVHLKVIMPGGQAELATFEPMRKRKGATGSSDHQHHH